MPCGCVLLAYIGLSVVGAPATTIQIEIESWKNTSWGFHSIDRTRTECQIAIASDGSRHNQCDSRQYNYYLLPEGRQRHTTLYLSRSHQGYQVDDELHTAFGGPCQCGWTLQQRPLDAECAQAAKQIRAEITNPTRIGNGQIAGLRVVRYFERSYTGEGVELALAPDAGCELMEETLTSQGTLGIPAARWRYRVTSYTRGEPDANLFKVPAGYSIQQHPR